nr:reverse transcriptase domain-containing protein [Tanacetum cinerariifolium]
MIVTVMRRMENMDCNAWAPTLMELHVSTTPYLERRKTKEVLLYLAILIISITSSSDPEIVALKAEMVKIDKNLMKVLQINHQVKTVTPSCETCGGPHSYNDCPATVGQTQNVYVAGAYQGVVTTIEFTNYMKENDAILKNMQTNMTSLTNSNLELKNMFGQFMKMNTASSSGSGTLPSNTVTNPKEDLKVERETEVSKDTVPPTNNGSTKDIQSPVVQVETPVPNFEPVVAPVAEPVVAPYNFSLYIWCMSSRSSVRNLFPPLDNPELTIRRRPRVDPTLLNDFEMATDRNGDPPVLDLRTMEELCQPTVNVQNSCQFHGLPGDDANKHLDKFLHVTQSIKVNGVTDDALRLYLFPHSLTHHAIAWFDHFLRNSITTCKQMAKMFLEKYFPPSMVTKLRNEITNFRQRPDESLFEAWKRYKLSIDRCPNHNMLPVTQIDTFYNGLTLKHHDTINAAAGGTFMKRRPEECYDIIENMTA